MTAYERTMASSRRRGFTLIELLVVVGIIAVLLSILLPALSGARRSGRLSVCQSNMRQYVMPFFTYASSYNGRIASFSWHAGVAYADFSAADNQREASANQAIDILRRLTGRDDFAPIPNWFPQPKYTHLVMQDYLANRVPEAALVCPEDRLRRLWQKHPGTIGALPMSERPQESSNELKRWPYSSSYEVVPAAWSYDKRVGYLPTVNQHLLPHYQYSSGRLPLGKRRLSEVAYPSLKVATMDAFQRHFGSHDLFYAYEQARQPLCFWDGHVAVKKTADADPGFQPNNFRSDDPSIIIYSPQQWEPPSLHGQADDLPGSYRWTRGGLNGADF